MSLVLQSKSPAYTSLAAASTDVVRSTIRQNKYAGHTAGLCDGLLQCNLVILPEKYAADFEDFCTANPIPCPLVGKSKVGEFFIENLGREIDLRTDLPLYNIHQNGKFIRSERDIAAIWRDDLVAFAIGCSFTFERALIAAGISMRHIEEDVTVPMFKTSVETQGVGPFAGPTVMSMRPIKTSDLDTVHDICRSYPHAHGVPLHVGNPSAIGISNLATPEWGAEVTINEDELPVFWGCGVTTQAALELAQPELCITHAPGAMLITKIDEKSDSDGRPAELPKEKIHQPARRNQ